MEISKKDLLNKHSLEVNLPPDVSFNIEEDCTTGESAVILRMTKMEETAKYNPKDNSTINSSPKQPCEELNQKVVENPEILTEATDINVLSVVDAETKEANNQVQTSKKIEANFFNSDKVLNPVLDNPEETLKNNLNKNLNPELGDKEELINLKTDAGSECSTLLNDKVQEKESLVYSNTDPSSKVEITGNGPEQKDTGASEMELLVVSDQDGNKNCLESELVPVQNNGKEMKMVSPELKTKPTVPFISPEYKKRKVSQCLETDPSSDSVSNFKEEQKTDSQFIAVDSASINVSQTASECSDSHSNEMKTNTSEIKLSTVGEERNQTLDTSITPTIREGIEENESHYLSAQNQLDDLEANEFANNQISSHLTESSSLIPLLQLDSGSSQERNLCPKASNTESDRIIKYTKYIDDENGNNRNHQSNNDENTSTGKNTPGTVTNDQEKASDTVTNDQEKASDTVTKVQEKASDTVTKDQEKVSDTVTNDQEKASDTVTKDQEKASDTVTKDQEKVSDTVTNDQEKASDTVTKDQEKASDTVTKDQEKVSDTVTNDQEKASDTVTKDQEKASDTVTKDQEKASDTVTKVQEKASDTVTKVQEKALDTVTKDQEKASDTVTKVQEKAPDTVTKDQEKAPDTVTKDQEKASDTVTKVQEKAPDTVTNDQEKASDTVTKVQEKVSDTVTNDQEKTLKGEPSSISFNMLKVNNTKENVRILFYDPFLPCKETKSAEAIQGKSQSNFNSCSGTTESGISPTVKESEINSDLDLRLNKSSTECDLDVNLKPSKGLTGDQHDNNSSEMITNTCLPVDQSESSLIESANIETGKSETKQTKQQQKTHPTKNNTDNRIKTLLIF